MITRITRGFFRSVWWCLLLGLVLVALYLSLGRLATLSASGYQIQIEQFLRDNGLPFVKIGELKGGWRVHDPILEITNLSVQPADEPAVEISRLTLRLDSLHSLLNGRPVVKEIDVSGLRFTVERNDQRLWVRGFEGGDGDFDLQYLLDSIPHLERLRLDDIQIEFVGTSRGVRLLSEPDQPWVIRAEDDIRRLHLPLVLERALADGSVQSGSISMTGHYQGDIRDPGFMAELYLDASHIDLEEFLPVMRVGEKPLTSAALNTQLWLSLKPGRVDLVGNVSIRDVRIGSAEPVADELSGDFRFTGPELTSGLLSLPGFSLRQGDFEFNLADIDMTVDLVNGGFLAGQAGLLDMAEVTALFSFLADRALIPERVGAALSAVSPGGELRDLLFFADLEENRPKVVGRLREFSMDAFLGIPAISPVNGFLSAEPDRGYLDIDNDAFMMHFTGLFPEAWQFDSGRGRIAYRVEEDSVRVTSGLIELLQGDLSAFGKVSLNLPGTRELQSWGLTIGVSDAELLHAGRYIPNTVPDGVISWLNRAILGGTGIKSGITIHGALSRRAPRVWKTHDLFSSVADADISYDPEWPVITDLEGTVHVNSYFVRAEDVTGRVYESEVSDANVFVPVSAGNKIDTVLVDARARGAFADGIRALNETPLAEITSNMAGAWTGTGEVASRLSLNVPLGERSGEKAGVTVRVALEDNDFDMTDFDLFIGDLTGQVTYSNDKGLGSPGFTGTVFNEPVTGNIRSRLNGGGGEVVIAVDGHVSVADLFEWSDQLLLSRAEGRLAYQTEVRVPYGGEKDEIMVEAVSDLAGVTIDLPEPLAKPDALSTRDFRYVQTFKDSGFRIAVELDRRVRASLKVEDGLVVGGRIHCGEEPLGAVTYDAIRMTGRLPYLSYGDWMTAADELAAMTGISLEDEISEHVASVTLNVDELMVFDLPLKEIDIVMTRDEAQWVAHLRNETLDGEVRILDDKAAPLEIDLNRLSFKGDLEDGDPFRDVNPAEIADVNFSVGQLLLNDEDYGTWGFHFRTDDQGARFESLEASVLGVDLVSGSEVTWRYAEDGHESRLKGEIRIDDLAEAQRRFGFAPSIEGQGVKISSDLVWSGSPAMVDANEIRGTVQIHEGRGRFVQAETGGALKLLGIFDFASIARRLRLDFSDVVDKGFEFNQISGVTAFDRGEIDVKEPIVINGSSGRFKVGGRVDLNSGTLDNDMIVTLGVGRTLPWYAAYSAIATSPLVGATVMFVQRMFRNQIDQFSSARYKITGTIEQPNIEFVAIFDDKVRKAQGSDDGEVTQPAVEPGE